MWQWTVDVDFVKTIWPEAVDIDPDVLSTLLYTASSLCAAYAPTHTDPGVTEQVPETWKLALIFQARHTWGQMSGARSRNTGRTVWPSRSIRWSSLRGISSVRKVPRYGGSDECRTEGRGGTDQGR